MQKSVIGLVGNHWSNTCHDCFFQGFVITLPYCFLNTEVRGILRQHFERWKASRSDDGFSRRRSARNSLTMQAFYSTATTDTRYNNSAHSSFDARYCKLSLSAELSPTICTGFPYTCLPLNPGAYWCWDKVFFT